MQITVYLRGLEFALPQPKQQLHQRNRNLIHFNESISENIRRGNSTAPFSILIKIQPVFSEF
jgi:hypothetical protein